MSRSTISERRYYNFTFILKLHALLAFNFLFSTAHMGEGPMKYHGPQTWPWWRLVAPRMMQIRGSYGPMPEARRLWLYTRWGAYYCDFMLDRRGVVQKRVQGWIRSWT